MILTRRTLLKIGSALGLAPLAGARIAGIEIAHADDRVFRHGYSLFGDLKYPPDFKHFDYVNTSAPKGGRIRLAVVGSFDSLNPYIVSGELAAGVGYLTETLTARSMDEVGGAYGLLAESLYYPDDKSLVVFRLRPEARWEDGTPVLPEDVVFGLNFLKEANPRYQFYYRNVA